MKKKNLISSNELCTSKKIEFYSHKSDNRFTSQRFKSKNSTASTSAHSDICWSGRESHCESRLLLVARALIGRITARLSDVGTKPARSRFSLKSFIVRLRLRICLFSLVLARFKFNIILLSTRKINMLSRRLSNILGHNEESSRHFWTPLEKAERRFHSFAYGISRLFGLLSELVFFKFNAGFMSSQTIFNLLFLHFGFFAHAADRHPAKNETTTIPTAAVDYTNNHHKYISSFYRPNDLRTLCDIRLENFIRVLLDDIVDLELLSTARHGHTSARWLVCYQQ